YFFFFQAEDGIRDKLVTGVQTCALPIFAFGRKTFSFTRDIDFFGGPALVVAATIAAVVVNQVVAADATGVHTSVALGLFRAEGRSEERRVGKECRARWSP